MHKRKLITVLAVYVLIESTLRRILKLERQTDLLSARLRVGYRGYHDPKPVDTTETPWADLNHEQVIKRGRKLYDELQRERGQEGSSRARELLVTQGSGTGTRLTLHAGPITIGRADEANLKIDDDYASSQHARIVQRASGEWFVEDLGSVNGTYVGRAKVTEATKITVGVPIRVGRTVLELRS